VAALADALTGVDLPPCPVVTARAALSPADAADLDTALADPSMPSAALELALAAVGVRVAAPFIRDHRALDCPCAMGA
jgi:hypothetical protein